VAGQDDDQSDAGPRNARRRLFRGERCSDSARRRHAQRAESQANDARRADRPRDRAVRGTAYARRALQVWGAVAVPGATPNRAWVTYGPRISKMDCSWTTGRCYLFS
jgi:hypothetical protein